MNTHADKIDANKSQSVSNSESQLKRGGESTFQFLDNRPEAIAQMKLQEMGNNSPQVSKLRALQEMANNSPQTKKIAQLQSMANNHSMQQHQTIQKKENYTGLPDNLKTGMENLSGISLDDVKVHRNSDKPAQLQAYAYAQGTDIHLASGQEKHLPHEAWHVVQQKQGRVQPTMQMKGKVNVNDDAGLEKEADVMGAKAENIKFNTQEQLPISLKKNTINPVRQNKLKIGGINITSFREKLLDFQKKGELEKHECYQFGEVLSYWIDQEQEYEFVSWDESIIKAKDEKLPEMQIPTLEEYWAAHPIAEAEVNPEAAEEVESNKIRIGGIDMSSLDLQVILVRYIVEDNLTLEEGEKVESVLSDWITAGGHVFDNWNEAFEKAKLEIVLVEPTPVEPTPVEPTPVETPEEKEEERIVHSALEEHKMVLKIPSGFPATEFIVEIRFEKESNGKTTIWIIEATGGGSYGIENLLEVGALVTLTLTADVQGGEVDILEAAGSVVKDFIMRQRNEDAASLKVKAAKALPAIKEFTKQTKNAVELTREFLGNKPKLEQEAQLEKRTPLQFWKSSNRMSTFVALEKIVKKELIDTLVLLGCKEPLEFKSFTAMVLQSVVISLLRDNLPAGENQDWLDFLKKLDEDEKTLKALFNCLNLNSIDTNKIAYSVQGMFKVFASIGNKQLGGNLKLTLGAGKKGSWSPDEPKAKFETILMGMVDLRINDAEGKLTAEYNTKNTLWTGELKVKIPGIIPDEGQINIINQVLNPLKSQIIKEGEKKQVVKVEKTGDSIKDKSVNFMQFIGSVRPSIESVYIHKTNTEKSGDKMSDLIVIISIQQVKEDKKSSYDVKVKFNAGKTEKVTFGGSSLERTTKTRLESKSLNLQTNK